MAPEKLELIALYENLPLFRDAFLHLVQQRPEAVSLTFVTGRQLQESKYTFNDLDRKARSVAKCIPTGEGSFRKIGVPAANNIDFVAGMLGCFYSGVIAVPIPMVQQSFSQGRGQLILNQIDLDGVLIFPSVSEHNIELLNGKKLLKVDENAEVVCSEELTFPKQKGTDIALIQFTSGTSGEPVGVCLSHQALVYNLMVIEEAMGHTQATNRIGLNWCPFYHDMGLIGGLLNPLYKGLHIIQMSPLDFLKRPISWLQCINNYRVTSSGGPTFAFQLLNTIIKRRPELIQGLDISCWEAAFCGAEPVNVDILEEFAALVKCIGFKNKALLPCYGMAEFGLFISGAPFLSGLYSELLSSSSETYRIASCGSVYGDTDVYILDSNRNQQEQGKEGDVYITGSSLLSGYWTAGEMKDCFCYLPGDSRPFLATGDLGYKSENRLYITGRKKHMIKINGVSHFPHHIVSELAKQIPSLDPTRGLIVQPNFRNPHLCIIHELSQGTKLSEDAFDLIRTEAIKHASMLTGTSDIEFIIAKRGSIPKTTSGKIIVPTNPTDLQNLKKALAR